MSEPDLQGLFMAHAQPLKSHLLRKSGDPQLAADLAQESFLRLTERHGRERIDNAPGWLYCTANNLLIDHYRRERCHRTDSVPGEVLEAVVEPCSDPEEQNIKACQTGRLYQAISQLQPRTQQVLRLNRFEGLTHAEVARCLGISPSSVQKHLTMGLLYVRARMQE